jgi:hypothetical protein
MLQEFGGGWPSFVIQFESELKEILSFGRDVGGDRWLC